jgi:hypothetical protein
MKSRRRIAFLKAWDHADWMDDYSRDLRLTKWGSEVSVHGSNAQLHMSALGQKRTSHQVRVMSGLPPKAADITAAQTNVRFVPKADSCTAAK